MSAPGRRTIKLDIHIDGRPVTSETTGVWAGPYVLILATVIPDHRVAFTLTSTFVGHRDVPTQATHLAMGPVGHDAVIWNSEHEHNSPNVTISPRGFAYEHIETLLEHLSELGHEVTIGVPDRAFSDFERAEIETPLRG